MKLDKRLIIIDGNSIINRAFYALPEMSNKEGLKTNAIYGFTNMLLKIVDTYKPTHISVALILPRSYSLAAFPTIVNHIALHNSLEIVPKRYSFNVLYVSPQAINLTT